MPAPRHLAWPPGLDVNGHLLTNKQDSDADVAAAISVILSYEPGARRGMPKFGVPLQAPGVPDLDEIRRAISANEPRAVATAHLSDDRLLKAIAQVQVEYTTQGEK